MLFVPRGSQDFAKVTSYAVGTRPGNGAFGLQVTPVTTNAYGGFATAVTALTRPAYGIYVNANSANAAAANRLHAIQIAVDYAGGTAFATGRIIVDGLVISEASSYGLGGGVWYYFPVFIPAGASIGVAGRGTVTTIFNVNIICMTDPPDPSMVKTASFVQTIGLTLGAGTVTGVTVTPSIAATETGGWTLIGTTTNRAWWWQFAVQQNGDTTMSGLVYHLDLAVGNGTTFDTIILDSYRQATGNETYNNIPDILGVEKVVPAGSSIYARIHNAGANDAGTYQIIAYGCGG